MKTVTVFLFAALLLSACASLNSVENPEKAAADGLSYFMPKRDFRVTVTLRGGDVSAVTLGTTPAYPDLSKQYVLRYAGNAFGKNTLDIGITESGLLTSAKSTTTSQVAEAFKNLATSAGGFSGFGVRNTDDPEREGECSTDGEHSFIYAQPGEYRACGVNITIKPQAETIHVRSHAKAAQTAHAGIFYRQNIPYLMTASGNGLNMASVVFSPSASATHFLPVAKTFFSGNEADFAFVDGIPTRYKQDTDGELVALFKLPADILDAYFSAIGSVFDNFKSTDQKEATALAESLKLELAQKKYAACLAAIRADDKALVAELGCE